MMRIEEMSERLGMFLPRARTAAHISAPDTGQNAG